MEHKASHSPQLSLNTTSMMGMKVIMSLDLISPLNRGLGLHEPFQRPFHSRQTTHGIRSGSKTSDIRRKCTGTSEKYDRLGRIELRINERGNRKENTVESLVDLLTSFSSLSQEEFVPRAKEMSSRHANKLSKPIPIRLIGLDEVSMQFRFDFCDSFQ